MSDLVYSRTSKNTYEIRLDEKPIGKVYRYERKTFVDSWKAVAPDGESSKFRRLSDAAAWLARELSQ